MNYKQIKILRYTIIFLTIIFVVVSTFILFLAKRKTREPADKTVNLEYWGFNVPAEVMNVLIEKYEKEHPNVKIHYVEKAFDKPIDYRNLLLTRLRKGVGPDIFRINANWTATFYPELSKTNYLTRNDVIHRFYPVVENMVVSSKDEVIAIPIMYDGLSLYYNKDMFENAGLEPPVTWDDLLTDAQILTVKDSSGMKVSGVAIGTVDNVADASDIISLLMIQNGVSVPNDLDTKNSYVVFDYYTDFSKKYGIWNDSMPNSLLAFATQRVAMIFATSAQLEEVLKINPTLRIGSTNVPQIPGLNGTTTNKTWASFWVESVSNDSTSQEQLEAWKFLDWLSQPEQQIERFNETSKYKPYGEVYSDMSLANNLLTSPYLSAVVLQAPYSKTNSFDYGAGNDEYVQLLYDTAKLFYDNPDVDGGLDMLKKLKENYFKVKY